MVNMNMFVHDIPLWYTPAIGPTVKIDLSYNSQSAIAQNEPFGNKWMFNYASYIVVDPSNSLTIFSPDGRRRTPYPKAFVPKPNCSGVLCTFAYLYEENGYQVQALEGGYDSPNGYYKVISDDGSETTYGIPSGTNALQYFITEIRDKDGHAITFRYYEQARMQAIIDAKGNETALIYNAQNLIERVDDPFGRSAHFTYDENRNLISLTDMQGYVSTVGYDENRYITYIEDAKGKTLFYTEPADGDNSIGSNSYPDFGSPMWENYRITATDPLGQKEEFYYDGYHGKSWYVGKEHYNELGNKDSIKTLYELITISSRQGKIRKIIYPDDSFIERTFDGNGRVTSIKNNLEQQESFTFNSK